MDKPPEKDPALVTSSGEPLTQLPQGVTFRRTPTHVDLRGSVCEMFDPRWQWHPDPVVFVYMFTIKPGKVKGWGLHKQHEDRYFVLFGEMEVVFYDVRPESPTRNQISKIVVTEYDRRLINIPAGIWHANRNIGTRELIVVNFPTRPYEHDDPDKYRLPLDTDQIPYTFENAHGW